MSLKSKTRRPAKRRGALPARGTALVDPGNGLALPHERDQVVEATAAAPDPVIAQAQRDIDAGQVDTDMRATPGLDAERRAALVGGPGGKAASKR